MWHMIFMATDSFLNPFFPVVAGHLPVLSHVITYSLKVLSVVATRRPPICSVCRSWLMCKPTVVRVYLY